VEFVDIILCAVSSLSKDELNRILKNAEENGLQILSRIVKVSRWPAYNACQLAEFKTLWPVNLRKDTTRYNSPRFKLIFRVVKNASQEAAEMRRFMLETINLSKQNRLANQNDLPITALLTNPKTSEVLLTAYDTRISTCHPLNHPIMNLLKQLPSLLPTDTSTAPAQDPYSDEEEQYYAATYDVYITHEPCTMCCMALVHSRIRRLVFWQGMATGARGLGWMKGDEEGTLNHCYMCFEGIEGALSSDIGVEDLGKDVLA
jgi:tRNA(Arg) A34 adenosine deaminase TadA